MSYNPFEDPQHLPVTPPEYKTEHIDSLSYADDHVERPKKSWLLHRLCFSLHAVLIGLRILLLFVWFTRFEHKIVVPIGQKSNTISTAIVQVSQIFATIYLFVLIFISQQLTTRRNLHARQTLTVTHDNMSAWTGLRAALLALWHQTTIAATVVGVFPVSAYLVCVGVLHVTALALFSLQPFNTSHHSVICTTLGPPNISINNLGRISKISLENGTLYDVLSSNNGEGKVFVNALTFNVTCGFVDAYSCSWWLPYYNYNVRDPVSQSLSWCWYQLSVRSGVMRFSTLRRTSLTLMVPKPGTYMDLSRNPEPNPPPASEPQPQNPSPQPAPQPQPQQPHPQPAPNPNLNPTPQQPGTDNPSTTAGDPDICNPLTVVEQCVMEDLGLHLILPDSPVQPAPVITLHDLENSLTRATAASCWYALYAKAGGLKNDDPYSVENVSNYKVEAMTGNATITYPYTAMRVNINLIPVAFGLGASIGLLILAYQLVDKPVAGDSGVDTIGVLQILWLMCTQSDLQRPISESDELSVDNLPRTAMTITSEASLACLRSIACVIEFASTDIQFGYHFAALVRLRPGYNVDPAI
ncbi:hypothetical protein DFS33DRAFT_1277931 [Desarmillaria ectypa]|nr:hypothetical protein DFS33DRAFT_1277931 [Desarmillaria ectypa]